MPDPSRLSIIIPVADDPAALAACLARLRDCEAEIIVAEASRDDACAALAIAAGVRLVRCEKRGRGPQLNAGAAVATGEILVFTHCDTELQPAHLASLQRALQAPAPGFLAGAFYKDLAYHYPHFPWAEDFVRWWSNEHGIIYGDQTLWCRRAHFEQLGGYPSLPLMEDVALSDALRRAGGVTLLDPPLRSSLRRFEQRGRLRTRLENLLYVLAFRCGVSAQRLYRRYYA